LVDEDIDGFAGLDKEDDFTGLLEFGAELFDRPSTDNIGPCDTRDVSKIIKRNGCRSDTLPLASFWRK